MNEILPAAAQVPATAILGAGGILLLIWGRKLFSLALAVLGAALGLHLAQQYVHASPQVHLLIAALLAVGGFVLAIMAQKLAVAVGGFALGGLAAVYIGEAIQADMNTGLWIAIVLGAAVLGGFLGGMIFDFTVALLTSTVGALLLVKAAAVTFPVDTFVVIGLTIAGTVLQTRKSRKNRLNQ